MQQFNNRTKRQLAEKISDLSVPEHEEIFKLIREHLPACPYTLNSNGIFLNMGALTDDVLHRIEQFVTFCMGNKKELDAYDQRLKECKLKNDLCFMKVSEEPTLFPVDTETVEATDTWMQYITSDADALKAAKYLYNVDRMVKKKLYTKFHAAKKRLAKKVAEEKRSYFDLPSVLEIE
jgi:hypothetical protein